ncbi:MAG: hypothetical protein JSS66_01455 [Armatimonadetes bacterium]|nr:hypothetical protein [Armatimonadota bacterium]
MLTPVFLLALHQDSPPTAGTVISKMIARYHDAKTLSGDCNTTLKVGARQINIAAKFQVERPKKIYLRQIVDGVAMPYIVTSDGKEFSYNKPIGLEDHRGDKLRLTEPVGDKSLGDIYRDVSESVVERSPILDLVVSDMRDLQLFRDQLTSMKLMGEIDLNGQKVYKIVGRWRLNSKSETNADFGIYITADGDLKRYALSQEAELGDGPVKEKVTVSRLYDVDIKVNSDLDQKLFAVLK